MQSDFPHLNHITLLSPDGSRLKLTHIVVRIGALKRHFEHQYKSE